MKGYRNLLNSDSRIVVVVDLDDEDCKGLKDKLEEMARQANLQTRTDLQGGVWQVVNRIAIEELEAWYFGDWEAVRAVYPKMPASIPQKRRFRNPDTIQGTWEVFEKVLQQHGYYRGGLLKIEAAQKIGHHIDPTRSRSHSFQIFWNAVLEAVQGTACVE